MLTLLATLMAGAGLVLAALAAYVAWRRGTAMGWSLAVLLVAVAWWGTAYAVELSADSLAVRSRWGDLKYVGIVTLAPAWLVFVLQYTGRGQLVTRRLVALLAIPPIAALAVLAVPATHDLVRSYSATPGAHELPDVQSGPVFWAIFAYNNLLLVGATVLFVASMVRLARTYRRMALVLLCSALLPWAANILHNLEVGWFALIDLTPFAFTVTGGLLVWGLFEERLVDLAPLARSAVVESMADAVFVLDAFERVVDVNPAAVALAGRTRGELIGRRVRDLMDTSGIVEVGPSGLVLADDAGGHQRTFDVSQQPLTDIAGRTAGELVVLREVTDRVRDQQHLQQVLDDRSRVAATLQASMVPTRLPAVPGCSLASRYVPAGDGGEIGGDFLDVFPLDEETWAFVLGDVSGKGAEAAAVSAATRYTLRALAGPSLSPAATLRGVNAVLQAQTESERHCTLVHGHLRPPRDARRPPRPRCASPSPSRATTGRWSCGRTARSRRSARSAPRSGSSTTPSCTTPRSSSRPARCCASSPTAWWRRVAAGTSSAPSGSASCCAHMATSPPTGWPGPCSTPSAPSTARSWATTSRCSWSGTTAGSGPPRPQRPDIPGGGAVHPCRGRSPRSSADDDRRTLPTPKGPPMGTLTVWKFDTADGADKATDILKDMAAQRLLTIHDAATVRWEEGKKKPQTKQLNNLAGAGALGGAFWGMLFGLIFFVPLLGAAIGAASGALAGSLSDVGIDDKFINRLREEVTPGTSALFIMTSDVVVDRVHEAFADSQPELIFTNLSDEQERAIREVFAEA